MRLELTRQEKAVYSRLTTPEKIQRFLSEDCQYNKEPDGPSCQGPRWVIRHRRAHCMEGSILAAAALRMIGYPPLIWDLETVRDDDHVLAIFQRRGHWGAIAKSNFTGLAFREPVYRTLRELAMSYFEHYFNLDGEKTLRGFSRPVNLKRFDHMDWMRADGELWAIPEYLCTISHTKVLKPGMERHLNRMDPRLFEAGKLGAVV
ncbi:MAG: transglutaminase domain-containing protein [Acidobacteria bacterium]|nr:transglutaminase domain-containing protein [Acidobacteriota bacterium]